MGKKLSLTLGLLALVSLVLLPSFAKADPPPAPFNLGPSNYVNGSIGSDREPTLTFTLPNPGYDVRYEIQISPQSDFSFPLHDCRSVALTPGAVSYTVGQGAGEGNISDCPSFVFDPLPNGSYYWRVASLNASDEYSDWTAANGGSVAFTVNAPRFVSDWPLVSTYNNASASLEDFKLHPMTHEPYMVYTDWNNQDSFGNPEISMVRYNGSNWVSVGSAGFAHGYGVSLVFAGDNDPYIAYTHNENSEVSSAQAMRFDGSSWLSLGQVNAGSCSAVAYGMKDNPSTGNLYVLSDNCGLYEVYSYSGSSWAQVGSNIPGNGGSAALGFNSYSSQPWVATYNYVEDAYKVFAYQSDWTQIGSSMPNYGFLSSLEIEQSGVPYISFFDGNNNNEVTVLKYDGSNWSMIGLSGFASNDSPRIASHPHTGDPYVVHTNGLRAGAMKFDGSGWVSVGSPWFTQSNIYNNMRMDFNTATAEPWIAFHDADDGNNIIVMKHETSGGGGGGGGNGGGSGTNPDGSKYSYNYYPVTLDINATISLSCDPSVTMNAIVGTGKSTIDANNQANCTVTTNNSSGYKMEWQASTDAMLNAQSDPFAAYSPAASTTPETWTVPTSTSAWGAKLAATSEGYNGGAGGTGYTYPGTGWGSDDSYTNGKFLNVSSSDPFQIMSKATETDVDGETQSVVFAAEIGADKLQPTGTYTQEVTVTATTL